MRKLGTVSTSVFLILWLLQTCDGILNRYDQTDTDITNNRDYGCAWYGGMNLALRCKCKSKDTEMVILEDSILESSLQEIVIQECGRVEFVKNAIWNLRSLRLLHLHDVATLDFSESSLYWSGYLREVGLEDLEGSGMPTLKILIENSNITQLSSYTFKGHLGEIKLRGVYIENMAPYTFALLKQTVLISIEDSIIKNVKLQSFKKLAVENLELRNVTIETVPSRMFSNITVENNFIIDGCDFDTVRSGGFIIYNPKYVQITNTKINQLDGDAFSIVTRGDVLLKNNTFYTVKDGAFKGIVTNRDIRQDRYIIFESDTFTALSSDSLNVTDLIPKFSDLRINTTCDCENIARNLKNVEFYSEMKCLYNSNYVTITNYKNNYCSVIKGVSTLIIVAGVVILLLFIISMLLFIYYRRVHRPKKYGSDKSTKKGNLNLIVPDGRTYRETELHVIVERADLLTTDL